jgi:hypothetical protein
MEFQPGNKFGKGRRGAKNRLASRVLEDLIKIWDEPCRPGSDITNGVAALRIMAKQNPADFAKLYCNLVPKEYWVESTTLSDMNDEELDKIIMRMRDEVQREEEASVHH